jgi:hypothetical protein
VPLLHQAGANPPCTKALGIKYFLQLHVRSIAVRQACGTPGRAIYFPARLRIAVNCAHNRP